MTNSRTSDILISFRNLTQLISRRAIVVISILTTTVALGFIFLPRGDYSWLTQIFSSPLFPVILTIALFVRPLFGIPLSPFSILIGLKYGVIPGFFVVLAGTVLTCILPYVIGRLLQDEGWLFQRFARPGEQFIEHTSSTIGVAVSRLSPTPADIISYGAGLSNVPLRPFVIGTVVGEAPWAFGYVVIGTSLARFYVPSLPNTAYIGAALLSITVAILALATNSLFNS